MFWHNATFVNDDYNITSNLVAKFSVPLHILVRQCRVKKLGEIAFYHDFNAINQF